MSYNLKNKNIVVLAMSFAVMMAMNKAAYSQDAASFLLDEPTDAVVQNEAENTANMVAKDLLSADDDVNTIEEDIDMVAKATDKSVDNTNELLQSGETEDTSFLDGKEEEERLLSEAGLDSENVLSASENDDLFAESDEQIANEEEKNTAEVSSNAIDAPRSPFENFGNAILSKVDNDLFNQMSKIEKQTTILNLELKREDVRNKVEALRAARILARQEAEERQRAEEQRLKDLEAERQAKILEAEEKLRAKEIELEKVRQGKLLNDYMNEMLVMNQKWIEKNAALQSRISELEDERKTLIATFEDKVGGVKSKADEVKSRATEAVGKYTASLKILNSQIAQLRKDILNSEARMQQMREQAANNPFAQGNLDPNSASTDLSMEYAIMDITGQGEDVIAKLVSRDGTTFTVHKGSVLRGGETVLKITEKYIAFDKKGIKAYLYPGGTIMEYEPVNTFSDAEKTPETTEKQNIRPEETETRERVFGKPLKESKSEKDQKSEVTETQKTPRVNSISFSQGMFAK